MRILKIDFDVSKRTVGGHVVIDNAQDFTPLRLAYQDSGYGEGLKLWFITDKADDELSGTDHYFALVMTGQDFVPVEWNYLSSIEVESGIVLHAFYVPSEKISQEEKQLLGDVSEKLEGENDEEVEDTES